MKKVFLTIFSLSVIFIPTVFAETASVEIYNNVNTSSNNSTSKTESHTDITVETNGKVTRYESDKPGSVSVKSVNGESEIKVNGVSVSGTPKNLDDSSANISTPKPTDKLDENEDKVNLEEKEIEKKTNQIEKLMDEIKAKFDEIGNIISSLFD